MGGTLPRKKTLTKSERDKLWRLRILSDPQRAADYLEKERQRARTNRSKPKTPEQAAKEKEQRAIRNQRY
jgi:hypothetical protein